MIPRLVETGFIVVVPALPGYGWSERPKAPIGPTKVAAMWRTLMDMLGYPRFLALGGDWGAVIHLNLFLVVSPDAIADEELRDFWSKVGAVRCAREKAATGFCRTPSRKRSAWPCTTIRSDGLPGSSRSSTAGATSRAASARISSSPIL
ncbi:Haloalkane dehalogenase [compost metagenome]